jgi:hypothetical protein
MENKIFDEMVAGQRAMLEAIRQAMDGGKTAAFTIGAIAVLKGQAKAMEDHILDLLPDQTATRIQLGLSDMLYQKSVETVIISKKVEEAD